MEARHMPAWAPTGPQASDQNERVFPLPVEGEANDNRNRELQCKCDTGRSLFEERRLRFKPEQGN